MPTERGVSTSETEGVPTSLGHRVLEGKEALQDPWVTSKGQLRAWVRLLIR